MEETSQQNTGLKRKLVAVLCIILGALGGMSLYFYYPLYAGQKVMLATRPVDPFSPLRGQYIAINYEISRVPLIKGAAPGKTVFVALKKGRGEVYKYESASIDPCDNKLCIKGSVNSVSGKFMNIRYGIEQYFIPRGSNLPRGELQVEARIAPSGRAAISRLFYRGKPIDF